MQACNMTDLAPWTRSAWRKWTLRCCAPPPASCKKQLPCTMPWPWQILVWIACCLFSQEQEVKPQVSWVHAVQWPQRRQAYMQTLACQHNICSAIILQHEAFFLQLAHLHQQEQHLRISAPFFQCFHIVRFQTRTTTDRSAFRVIIATCALTRRTQTSQTKWSPKFQKFLTPESMMCLGRPKPWTIPKYPQILLMA